MTEQETKRPKSGLRDRYRVELADGSIHEVQTELSDVLRWETQHGGQSYLAGPLSMERMAWVVWRAGVRLKTWEFRKPDEFFAALFELENITGDDDDEDGLGGEDPTEPTPTD